MGYSKRKRRLSGVITALKEGYGFLADSLGVVRFFHAQHLMSGPEAFDDLGIGDRVEFDPLTSPKGPRAINVTLLQKAGTEEREAR